MNLSNQVQSQLQMAEQVCNQHNVRLTKKRRQVLTLLLLTDKAIPAYGLIELFKEHFKEDLSPMTAYRTLEFLEDINLTHRLKTENKYIACSHIGCKSAHDLTHFLICQNCLRVNELNNSPGNHLSELEDQAEQTGYQLSSPQIELNGVCSSCLAQKNNNKSN